MVSVKKVKYLKKNAEEYWLGRLGMVNTESIKTKREEDKENKELLSFKKA